MSTTPYEVVERDGGFAYRIGDGYSETFPSRDDAMAAAAEAAERRQQNAKEAAKAGGDARAWHNEASNEPGHETDVIKSGSQRY